MLADREHRRPAAATRACAGEHRDEPVDRDHAPTLGTVVRNAAAAPPTRPGRRRAPRSAPGTAPALNISPPSTATHAGGDGPRRCARPAARPSSAYDVVAGDAVEQRDAEQQEDAEQGAEQVGLHRGLGAAGRARDARSGRRAGCWRAGTRPTSTSRSVGAGEHAACRWSRTAAGRRSRSPAGEPASSSAASDEHDSVPSGGDHDPRHAGGGVDGEGALDGAAPGPGQVQDGRGHGWPRRARPRRRTRATHCRVRGRNEPPTRTASPPRKQHDLRQQQQAVRIAMSSPPAHLPTSSTTTSAAGSITSSSGRGSTPISSERASSGADRPDLGGAQVGEAGRRARGSRR